MKKLISFIFALTISCQCLFADMENIHFFGDLRTKWKELRSGDESLTLFLLEANVNASYKEENTWMCAKVKAYTAIVDGNLSATLEKAYIGFSFSDMISMEIGRNNLDDIFDSKTQFRSHFNGIHLAFAHEMANIGSLFVHGGPYIIDSAYNRCAYIAETGMSNIMDTRLEAKYSVTVWLFDTISQATIKYHLDKITPYVAFLRNHETQRNGMYLGVTLGQIIQAKDAYLDLNYQYTQSNCLPLFDSNGIGTGINSKAIYAITDKLHGQVKLAIATEKQRALEVALIYNW